MNLSHFIIQIKNIKNLQTKLYISFYSEGIYDLYGIVNAEYMAAIFANSKG